MTQAREGAPCPEPVLAAIPWYPDGLSDAQQGAVEVHAAECGECREEIALVQGSSETASAEVPDPERVFARVMALVESDERGDAGAGSQLRPQTDGLARAAALRPCGRPVLAMPTRRRECCDPFHDWKDR